MCLAQVPQRSDAHESRTPDPSVSSQALYHWATAPPETFVMDWQTMHKANDIWSRLAAQELMEC